MNILIKRKTIVITNRAVFMLGMAAMGSATSAATLSISNAPLFLQDSVQSNVYFVIDDSGSMRWETVYTAGGQADYGMGSNASGTTQIGPSITLTNRADVLRACYGVNSLYYNPNNTYTPWYGKNKDDKEYSDQSITAAEPFPYGETVTGDDDELDSDNLLDNSTADKDDNEVIGYFPWYDHDSDGYADLYVDMDGDSKVDAFIDQNGNNVFDGFVDLNDNGVYDGWVDQDGDGVAEVGEWEFESELECPDRDEIPKSVSLGSGSSISELDFLKKWIVYTTDMSADEQTNYANWYSYYRKRKWVAKRALSEIITDSTQRMGINTIHNRDFEEVKDIDNITLPYDDDSKQAETNKEDLLDTMFQIESNDGTPLRSALRNAGKYYQGTWSKASSPILGEDEGGACQQNFTILMTDGVWNGDSGFSIANEDKAGDLDSKWDGGYYADDYSNTLADVAMRYYETDLDTTLDDRVPVNEFDENTAQHMVTYTVAFGVSGTLDADAWEDYTDKTNYAGDVINSVNDYIESSYFPGWVKPESNKTSTIDDVWHAAYNGRGLFLNAQDPQELIDSLDAAIADIQGRDASASAVSVTTGSVTTSSMLYTAEFNSSSWTGRVLGYPISTDGSLGVDPYVASVIPGDEQRTILTWNKDSDAAVMFEWDEIGATNQTQLGSEDILEYLRGETSYEDADVYRDRGDGDWIDGDDTEHYLGDIIDSAPVYVANSNFLYRGTGEFATHSAFRLNPDNNTDNNIDDTLTPGVTYTRMPMLYVGANDGMLHAFKVDPNQRDVTGGSFGEELFAYVPSMLYHKLPELADDTKYSHYYYVDGTPTVGDAYFDDAWHTVLVGGLNGGGQGIYAIDITDPDQFDTDSNALAQVLWEFNDDSTLHADGKKHGDKDLGYTYSKPVIAKANNGKWVAIFGNGYNNSIDDTEYGGTIGNSKPVLYVVDIEDGSLIAKLEPGINEVTTSPNGLSSPATLDTDGDYDVDYVYAGDLEGNLWKFDLTSSDEADWDVAYSKSGVNLPLYTACTTKDCDAEDRQPITVQPVIGFNDGASEYQIYFGTGTYFMTGDNSSKGLQTFYSIWDRMLSNTDFDEFDRSYLLKQEILTEASSGDYDFRITSRNLISWHNNSDLPTDFVSGQSTTHLGWYMDLYNTDTGTLAGERVVSDIQLRDDDVIFVTVIPDPDPCAYGGNGWYMEVSANGGSSPDSPTIDVNKDGVIDESDFVLVDGKEYYPGGEQENTTDHLLSAPVCISLGDGTETCYSNTSNATVEEIDRDSGVWYGRWMWREL